MPARVLLVEDSPTMRSFVSATLDQQGYEVTTAESGFAALKALPGGRFDLVITDVNMPDINGLELIRFCRSNPTYAQTPVIIISTEGREKDRDRGMSLGAAAYLVKPFTPDALLSLVGKYVPAPGG